MSALALRTRDFIQTKSKILIEAIDYFNSKTEEGDAVAKAAEFALSDSILFEEFELWRQNKNDEVLLFHIKKYFEHLGKKPLSMEERNLTGNSEAIQKIKSSADSDVAQLVAKKLNQLANQKKLMTNKQIGEFIGGMDESQVRVILNGEHKPQRKTLLKLAEAFDVPVEFFISD